MAQLAQLIIEDQVYPEASGNDGTYSCKDVIMSKQLIMISGEMVEEEIGTVAEIRYKYKYFPDDLMRKCLYDLKVKRKVKVAYLSPDQKDLKVSTFLCTEIPNPDYYMEVDGVPYWENIEFALREVEPHA